jgi:hypothetical protein
MKKILFINNAKVFLTNFGGYSLQLHHLFKIFQELGYDVHYLILCLDFNNNSPFNRLYTFQEIKEVYQKSTPNLPFIDTPILTNIKYFSYQKMDISVNVDDINKIVRENDINLVFFLGDVILFRDNKPNSIIVPNICWYPCHYYPINKHDNQGLNVFQNILCLCPSIKNTLSQMFPNKKIYYLPHITERIEIQESVEDLRKKWGLPLNKFIVLINASLYESTNRKAIDNQIIGFQKFQSQHPDTFLFIHSAGKLKGYDFTPQVFPLIPLLQKLGMTSEHYMWNQEILDQKQLSEIYYMCDALLSCSKSEGFGVPILEAQLHGLRVVTTDFLSMKEHNFQSNIVDVSTEEYNYYQSGIWTIPSSKSITDILTKIYANRHDKRSIRRSEWIVKKLTSLNTVQENLYKIISNME